MNLALESIGLIAGSRSLPLEFARLARAAGVKRIVAAAAEGETDPALASLVDDLVWIKVGQLGKLISIFTSRDVKQCVMLGQIAPKNLFDLRPDLRAMGVMLRLKEKNAHSIFGAIANELKKDGVELIEDAIDLPAFRHPLHAAYVLGPELGMLSNELLSRCDHVIKIPSAFCINVAMAGAIVMYDRIRSLGTFPNRGEALRKAAAGDQR